MDMVAADISFWSVVWYVIAGLVIGLLARLFLPGRQKMGVVATIVLGVIAAIVGGFLWDAIFTDQRGIAWIGSVVVAVILLWLYSRYAARSSGSE